MTIQSTGLIGICQRNINIVTLVIVGVTTITPWVSTTLSSDGIWSCADPNWLCGRSRAYGFGKAEEWIYQRTLDREGRLTLGRVATREREGGCTRFLFNSGTQWHVATRISIDPASPRGVEPCDHTNVSNKKHTVAVTTPTVINRGQSSWNLKYLDVYLSKNA